MDDSDKLPTNQTTADIRSEATAMLNAKLAEIQSMDIPEQKKAKLLATECEISTGNLSEALDRHLAAQESALKEERMKNMSPEERATHEAHYRDGAKHNARILFSIAVLSSFIYVAYQSTGKLIILDNRLENIITNIREDVVASAAQGDTPDQILDKIRAAYKKQEPELNSALESFGLEKDGCSDIVKKKFLKTLELHVPITMTKTPEEYAAQMDWIRDGARNNAGQCSMAEGDWQQMLRSRQNHQNWLQENPNSEYSPQAGAKPIHVGDKPNYTSFLEKRSEEPPIHKGLC